MKAFMGTIADRILGAVVPRTEAQAACSGCWNQCSGSSCDGWAGRVYHCCYKPNCTDTCSYTGYCCA